VEMGVGEVVRANLLGERENIGPILPQGCLLEIDGLKTAGLLVTVWFTELSFNACALPRRHRRTRSSPKNTRSTLWVSNPAEAKTKLLG
jgi:hypothetical protein